MMQRAALLSDDDVARVADYARDRKLAAVEAVLELGLSDEASLVSFLQSKLMIPAVSDKLLHHLDHSTLAQLPADLAWYHGVLPVSMDDVGNLTLAMADPTDLRAVDAIAGHTGAYLVRAVAPLSPLLTALNRYYGPRPTFRAVPTPRALPIIPEIEADPSLGLADLIPTAPLSSSAFQRILPKLHEAADRDEITELLLSYLAEGFSRVIMFVHLRDQLRGRDARGSDILSDAVTQVRIPTTGDSAFSDAVKGGAASFGTWSTARAIDRAFAQALGGIESEVLLLPIRIRDKVPLLVFASGNSHPVEPETIQNLTDAVSKALERLIFKRKKLEAPN